MPIFLGHLMKILTQVVLIPVAQKALTYFFYKIDQHEKKKLEKLEKKEMK